MARLSEKQRIEILMMIGYGDRVRTQNEVCELFNNKYPERPITQSAVSKIEKKFRDLGHVRDVTKGRPSVSDNKALDILLTVEDNPHISSRAVAADNSVCQSTVLKYLKRNKWHPYKVQLVQELLDDDFDRRLEFCETMMNHCNNDPQFVRHVVFSDEATFYLNGIVNRQNCRYWAPANPHWMMEDHTQFPLKVNVWAGIIENKIVGPFFIEGPLNSDKYLDLLEHNIIPALVALYPNNNNPQIPNNSLWYQQDGAPPHYSRVVRDYLDATFPNRWIGRRGTIEWPPRSPDLTPLDYFLWGYLKSKVYFQRPANIGDLQNRITQEIEQIGPEIISNVLREFEYRLAHCQAVNGRQFEHLI